MASPVVYVRLALRLLTATNPESGLITYTYDANGNLATRVRRRRSDQYRANTTAYTYDVLNRVTQRLHQPSGCGATADGVSPTGCNVPLPAITSPTNLIGRRSAACFSLSSSCTATTLWAGNFRGSKQSRLQHRSEIPVSYSYFKGSLHTDVSQRRYSHLYGRRCRTRNTGERSKQRFRWLCQQSSEIRSNGALTSMVNGHTGTSGITTSNVQ